MVTASVATAFVKGYEYRSLQLDGKTDNGRAVITSSIDDENLKLLLNANADVSEFYPSVKVSLRLDTANLHALHLYNDTLGFSTNLEADFISTNPDSLVGNLLIDHLALYTAGKHLVSDSIAVQASNSSSVQSLKLQSAFAKADWIGKYRLTEVPLAMTHTLDHYFHVDGFKDTAFTAQQWSVNVSLDPRSKPILAIVPELDGSDSVRAFCYLQQQRQFP